MLAEILFQLQKSRMPASAAVKKWLAIALIKKMGVLNLPYHCWHTDPKINPPAKYLLWAAILAEDKERFAIVEGIIHTELRAAESVGARRTTQEAQAAATGKIVNRYVNELLALSPKPAFRNELAGKVKKILPSTTRDFI